MIYKKSAHAGETCLARRKKINRTGFTLAGTAALFVALAGNVLAVPFTVHDDVVNAAIRSQSSRPGQSDYEMLLALDHGNRNQSQVSPTAFIVPRPARIQNTGQLGSPSPRISRPRRRGHVVTTTLTQPTDLNPSAESVPDGGSTAVILGGAFFGLVFLEKKLKEKQ